MVDSTGTIRCRHESNVDIPGGIHHTTGLHQLPPLHLHQPAVSTIGKSQNTYTITLCCYVVLLKGRIGNTEINKEIKCNR